jgi:hypothetical protein
MKIRSTLLAVLILGIFISGILLSMAFNVWNTKSTKIPARYTSGEFEGVSNPADIRGSYTLDDITRSFAVPHTVLIQAFALPADTNPGEFRISTFEEIYLPLDDGGEVGTDSVRLFVARVLGLPYTPEDTTRLPAPAAALLKEKLAVADFDQIKKITVSPGELTIIENTGAAPVHEQEADGMVVKGKVTFYDLLQWGLSKNQIEGVLGIKMGATAVTVRDYCMENDIEFSTVKEKLQNLLDQM